MSEPRPLSREERSDIEEQLANAHLEASEGWFTKSEMLSVLAAEAFWRSAVKNADVCGEIGVPCPWCGARSYDQNIEASHRYGCEFLKAQE